MSTPLKIDFVSDVSCPWCVVGLYGLTRALDLLGDEVQAEIRFQPFELNPKMGPEGQNITEHITEKYGSTPEQSQKNREMIRARGAEVGFAFRTDGNSRIYNTFDAHRLLYWAGLEGLQFNLKEALFKAYFTEAAILPITLSWRRSRKALAWTASGPRRSWRRTRSPKKSARKSSCGCRVG